MAVAVALLHLALALLAFNPAPHVGGGNGAYVALARSLLKRGDYVQLWDPAPGRRLPLNLGGTWRDAHQPPGPAPLA